MLKKDGPLTELARARRTTMDVEPMVPKRTLVTGCRGQLGRAIRALADRRGLLEFEYTDIDEFDNSDGEEPFEESIWQ